MFAELAKVPTAPVPVLKPVAEEPQLRADELLAQAKRDTA